MKWGLTGSYFQSNWTISPIPKCVFLFTYDLLLALWKNAQVSLSLCVRRTPFGYKYKHWHLWISCVTVWVEIAACYGYMVVRGRDLLFLNVVFTKWPCISFINQHISSPECNLVQSFTWKSSPGWVSFLWKVWSCRALPVFSICWGIGCGGEPTLYHLDGLHCQDVQSKPMFKCEFCGLSS